MVFKSIRTKIVVCMVAWLVIMLSVHISMGLLGVVPFSWWYVLLGTVATVIPFFLFVNYLYVRIIRPIDEFSDTMKSIVHGIIPELPPNSGDEEMGYLAKEVKILVHALSQRDNLLKGMNRRLDDRNKELAAINDRLAAVDRVKTNFLAGVTHELKTPLSTITGYTEMMREGVGGELNQTQRNFVDEIAGSASHLLLLVNDVLDFSKAAGGTMELKFEQFDISKLINEVETNVRPMMRNKEQRFEVFDGPGISLVVADHLRIKQVVLNLLSNAIKFTPIGGRISIRSFKDNEHWGIVVTDNGIGIKEENFSMIFEPFSQADSSYSRRFEGTGLGLAICQRIVSLHGGRIWVESKPGNGSSFSFIIPRDLAVLNEGKDI